MDNPKAAPMALFTCTATMASAEDAVGSLVVGGDDGGVEVIWIHDAEDDPFEHSVTTFEEWSLPSQPTARGGGRRQSSLSIQGEDNSMPTTSRRRRDNSLERSPCIVG